MDDNIVASSPYGSLPISSESRCIRLLEVHASTLKDSTAEKDPIHCSLSVADLDERPSFTALSYVWGVKSPNPDTISCNGVALPVTANCQSALRHLRTKLGTFKVWVDAVCINQDDMNEKSHQISLMGDIYTHAQSVYIWLGEGSDATERAITYLFQTGFLPFFFKNSDPKGEVLSKPRFWAAVWSFTKTRWSLQRSLVPHDSRNLNWSWRIWCIRRARGATGKGFASYDDLHSLLDCAWPNRIWTYQEIILANNPIIVCGHDHIDWAHFASFVILLPLIRHDEIFIKWLVIVMSREQFRSRDSTTGDWQSMSTLTQYGHYVSDVLGPHRYLIRERKRACIIICGLLVAALGAILFLQLARARTSRQDWLFWVILTFLIILFACLLLTLHSYLAPNPGLSALRGMNEGFKDLLIGIADMETDIGTRFLESICTRKSGNPSDMSFGLRTILEKSQSKADPPPVDYSLDYREVYRELTLYFFASTSSLQPLLLAAQKRCAGAPSWVPDYSNDTYPRGLPFLRPNPLPGYIFGVTPRSKPLWEYDPEYKSLLCVKGFLYHEIVEVLPIRPVTTPFSESEGDIHLRNLDAIIRLTDSLFYSQGRSTKVSSKKRGSGPETNFHLFFGSVEPRLLGLYLNTVHYAESATQLLSYFTGPRSARRLTFLRTALPRIHLHLISGNQLFQTHVAICNHLAQLNTTYIVTKQSGFRGHMKKPNNGGYCYSGDVRVGDCIALVSGLSLPLIVRPDERLGTVRLVAPVALTDMSGRRWIQHDSIRKAQWVARMEEDPNWKAEEHEDEPQAYLDDLVIS